MQVKKQQLELDMEQQTGSKSGKARAAPGKSGLHARGEGERVLALESREGTRALSCIGEGNGNPLQCSCLENPSTALTYSFPDLEPVCCSMSSSNCCFLTCIQISQEAGQVAENSPGKRGK